MEDNKKIIIYLILAAAGVCYFFFLGERGVVFGNDSGGYINASYEREPFYPLVIMACRALFGEGGLHAVVLLQGSTALISCLVLASVISRKFGLKKWETAVCFALLLLPFGLDTMWSQPKVNYSHLILTECFSYAFFYLYLTAVICYIQKEKNTLSYICMLLLSVIMMMNRNQMELCFVLTGLLSVWMNLIRARVKRVKKCIAELIGAGAAVAAAVLLTLTYNDIQWGYFEKSSENTFTMMSNLLYASDAEDAELFEDEEARAVFEALYAGADQNGWTHAYAGSGWYEQGEAVAACHDRIKYQIIRPFFQQYVTERGMEPMGFESDRVKKEMSKKIQDVLWKAHFGDWLYHAFCMMPKGFVLSVMPIAPAGGFWYAAAGAVLVWVFFLFMLFRLLFSKKHRKGDTGLPELALVILGFIAMNVAALCLVIFIVPRYLNYTQGMFWIVFFLMLRELLCGKTDGQGDSG